MNNLVLAMALIRFCFGALCFAGACLMMRANDVARAVRINAFLASVGPFVFLTVSLLGIAGLASRISPARLALVITGVACVLAGTR